MHSNHFCHFPVLSGPVLEDWDIISPKDVIGSDQLQGEKRSLTSTTLPFTQSLLSQVTDDVLHPVSQLFYQPVSTAFSQVPDLLMQSHINQRQFPKGACYEDLSGISYHVRIDIVGKQHGATSI